MDDLLSAIVLAGGKSSRMGQDKSLILVHGEPLLQRTCQVALRCTGRVAVLTSRIQNYQTIVPPECCFLQEQSFGNELLPQGPLVGFAQAFTWVDTEWVLLLACDLPYLQANILHRWINQLPSEKAAIALLPKTNHGWEPLCGFYHRRCFTTLRSFVQAGGRSFQQWLAQVPVQAITFSTNSDDYQQEQNMLFNCNTPDDLAQLT